MDKDKEGFTKDRTKKTSPRTRIVCTNKMSSRKNESAQGSRK